MKLKLFFAFFFLIGLFSSYAQSPLNALYFDGNLDFVSMDLPTVFDDLSANDFTVETWVRPEGTGTRRIFFAQKDASNFVSFMLDDWNNLYLFVSNTIMYSGVYNSTLSSGQWTHILVTWDAQTNNIKLYVNGLLQTLNNGFGSSYGNDNIMTIGSSSNGAQNFKGMLDEFRIWDYQRSSCEIFSAMNTEFTVPPPGLIACYKFNEGVAGGTNTAITTLPDLTGNYNGTLNNFALTGNVSNWVSSGANIFTLNQNGIVNTAVTQNGNILTANATNASFQWLNCNNGFALMPGQVNPTFMASASGSYAVEVLQYGCVDTSACYTIIGLNIQESDFENSVLVYPVPSNDKVIVNLGSMFSTIRVVLMDNIGSVIYRREFQSVSQFNIELPEAAGYYFIEVSTSEGKRVRAKLIKD